MGGGGGNTFWNFQRQGGVKTWKLSVVVYGYFLELPNSGGAGDQRPRKFRRGGEGSLTVDSVSRCSSTQYRFKYRSNCSKSFLTCRVDLSQEKIVA